MQSLFYINFEKIIYAVVFGVLSAAALYGLFVVLNFFAERMFSFAREEISSVYTFKDGVRSWHIALMLIFVIGPGEEIFWRGYLQRLLSQRFGFAGVVLSIAAYTAAHLASMNIMLIAAAAVCGTFWSLIFMRYKSVWLNIISHVLWDLMIFIVWPLS
jgi:membrane protease YdiL (CAAX protease family)